MSALWPAVDTELYSREIKSMFSEVISLTHLPWALMSPNRIENKTLDTSHRMDFCPVGSFAEKQLKPC